MKTLSPRERIMVVLGLCVAMVIVAMTLFPGAASGRRSLAEERRRSRALSEELTRVREEVSGLEREIERRMVAGTPRQLVREMIQSSQAAARAAELQIDDLKPMELQNTPGFRRVPVQISLSGPFPKVVRFLYELQLRRDRYHVDQLRMHPDTARTDWLDLELQLVAFVQGEENDAGS